MNLKRVNDFRVAGEKLGRLTGSRKWGWGAIYLLPLLILLPAKPAAADSMPVLTTVREVQQKAEPGMAVACNVRLEGVVLWARPDREQFIFQDDSGGMRVDMDLRSRPRLQTGGSVILEGRGMVGAGGFREALIKNDGIHPAVEKSETIFLEAGRHPIRVEWFNASNLFALDVSYAGPELPRERISDSALFRLKQQAGGNSNWINGLDYLCYEGVWDDIPNFGELPVRKSGGVPNFDLSVRTRDESVGLQFNGFIQIPRPGLYTFWDSADDGSQLFIDKSPLQLSVKEGANLPIPQPISFDQPLAEDRDCRWSVIEGTITFAGERSGSMELELNSGTGFMEVHVAEAVAGYARLLLNSHVRITGISQSTLTTEGRRVAGKLLVPGVRQIEILEPAFPLWKDYSVVPIALLTSTNFPDGQDGVVHVRGKLSAVRSDRSLVIEDETGRIEVETTQPPPANTNVRFEVLGWRLHTGTNVVLSVGFYRAVTDGLAGTTVQLPLLTSIEQVKSLDRVEAQKGYPVKVRGVVTAPIYSGFFLQDGAWAIFVRWEGLRLVDRPRTGDYWEVQGTSYAEFSPNIQARSAERLGASVLPEPLHPAPDQFFNGSLDTRYIEIQGVVTASESNSLEMIIPEGRIEVQLSDIDPSFGNQAEYDLKRYENARIRLRGCAIPSRDEKTQQVQLGHLWIWLCNFLITVDHPAPVDPFSAPLKNISELRQFNPNASILQGVKVAGQVIHERSGEFFLWDGSQALRFIPRKPVRLMAGDMVEVAGFPDFGGSSIILREAMVRTTGHAVLPEPRVLANEFLLNQTYDGTLVRLRARLTDVSTESADQILTLQAGAHGFIARLNARRGVRADLLPGSLLELSGVYVAKGPDVPSFDLLLNSPQDIRVLTRPDWWTLRRLLAAFGLIVLVLAGALLWIFTLRRRVKKQTLIIHQKVEREATLEERARIARDIHDTLEQALAGTSLQLNALADALPNVSPEPLRVLKVARSMVHHAQEEARRTVMNLRFLDLEKHDLPAALADLATDSGNESPIAIQVSVQGARRSLSSKVESHLLRIAQESITNAIKHAQANGVRLELNYDPTYLLLTVQDDGCGFNADSAIPAAAGHFGLLGMRERAEKIGGTLQIISAPGQGTTIQVRVPWSQPNSTPVHDRPPAT